MAGRLRRAAVAFAVLCLGPAVAAGNEDEHVARAGGIEIVHAWSRATDEDVGGLFEGIASEGTASDRLVGAGAEIASRIELHGAVMRDGMMTSEPLGALALPRGGGLKLEPHGALFKLIGLERPLREGEEYVARIEFAEAGPIEIRVQIEPADATRHSHKGHDH
jgi:hypothetical protein